MPRNSVPLGHGSVREVGHRHFASPQAPGATAPSKGPASGLSRSCKGFLSRSPACLPWLRFPIGSAPPHASAPRAKPSAAKIERDARSTADDPAAARRPRQQLPAAGVAKRSSRRRFIRSPVYFGGGRLFGSVPPSPPGRESRAFGRGPAATLTPSSQPRRAGAAAGGPRTGWPLRNSRRCPSPSSGPRAIIASSASRLQSPPRH